MLDSVGKRLSQTRLKKGITLDEAAHATKLRPDKIAALENDDYSRFPSNAYAKGFLQIYGRFLKVDVTDSVETLDSTNHISIADYQYLSNGIAPAKVERQSFTPRDRRRAPSILPLVAFVCLLLLGAGGFQMYVYWKRIAGEPVGFGSPAPGSITPASATPPVKAAGGSDQPASAPPAPATLDGVPVLRAEALTAPVRGVPASTPEANPAVSDRDFIAGTDPANPQAGAANEILVQPTRTTWITVRRDDPKSSPIFEGDIYPDAPALKLTGARIFIEAREPSAIVIRKNGAPMAYQPPGIEIR